MRGHQRATVFDTTHTNSPLKLPHSAAFLALSRLSSQAQPTSVGGLESLAGSPLVIREKPPAT